MRQPEMQNATGVEFGDLPRWRSEKHPILKGSKMSISNMGHPGADGNGHVIPFSFDGVAVRVFSRDGDPWFVLADICRVLDIANIGNAAARLDEDEKGSIRNPDATSAGGNPNLTIVNESGLYSLVLASRKPEAKPFKKWVTSEVLPTIRKTGSYGTQAVDPMQVLNDPASMRGLLLTYSEKVLTLQAEVKAMAPDVAAYNRIANTDGLLNLTEAAKVLSQQPRAFNRWLSVNRYVYRRPGGSLLAYQDRIQSGYLEHKLVLYQKPDGSDGSRDQVMVTRRGLTHFAKKLGVALPDDLFGHSIAAE